MFGHSDSKYELLQKQLFLGLLMVNVTVSKHMSGPPMVALIEIPASSILIAPIKADQCCSTSVIMQTHTNRIISTVFVKTC